jgi:hypothetical protein
VTRTRKTAQQRATDELATATSVAKRALKKRDATKAAADKAQQDYDIAEQRRAFLAGSPFLPKPAAPRSRGRAPEPAAEMTQ